jgi:hypothetical protein
MAEFDRLAPELRAWLAGAVLPWSPRSAARSYARALTAAGGDKAAALGYLRRLELERVATDAALTWGAAHPAARPAAGSRTRP